MRILFTALAVLLLTAQHAASFDYSAYKPASIPEIINEHRSIFFPGDETSDINISATTFKYRIASQFTRELREISADTRQLLEIWGKALHIEKSFLDLYQHEFLVRDGEQEYWIPVQEHLLPAMGNELQVGSRFNLYVGLVGTINQKWVFIATEFDSPAE